MEIETPPPIGLPNLTPGISLDTIWENLTDAYPRLFQFLADAYGFLSAISLILSVFFFLGIIYCVEQLKTIRNKEGEKFTSKVEPALEPVQSGDVVMAARWKKAQEHIHSENPNDWKHAIMEADIILDDLLTKLGYRGESIGEKLKRVEPGDMKSLNDAWEAHKVRNQIAHEHGFSLDHRTAQNTLNQYKRVFEEFYYI